MTFLVVLQNIFEILNNNINKVLIALFIVVLGFILGRIVRKMLERVFVVINLDGQLRKISNTKQQLSKTIPMTVSIIIYAVAIVFAFRQLQIAFKYWFWIFIGLVTITIISVLLGLQDLINNFFAGIKFNNRYDVTIGDKIRINNIRGKILKLKKDCIVVRQSSNDCLLIPYSFILRNNLIKYRI